MLTGCTSAAQPGASPSTPVETEIPFSAPAGMSDTDFDVDTFNPCSPFRSTLWLRAAVVDPQLAPQTAPEPPSGCRWRGPGMTAAVAVEKGRSLKDYSTDPRFRPGERGWDGNSIGRQTRRTRRGCATRSLPPAGRDRTRWCT